MEENKEDYYSLQDIINTSKSFIKYLGKKWLLLLIVLIVATGLAITYYYKQKPKYEAISTFILEDKAANNNALAGLASQFGFNLGSLTGGGNLFAGDNILTILKSKKVIEQVLLSGVDSINLQSLADYYLEFTGKKESWQKKPHLANVNFKGVNGPMTPLQDSVLSIISDNIVKKHLVPERVSKQGSIIRIKITAPDCLFAWLMAERLVEEAARLYTTIRVGTAQENIRQLQRRADSLLLLLNIKSYSTAANQPLDINPGIKTAIVPVEIGTRDKAVLATLYAEVAKNLEASKLLLSQQTPVIQVLDKPGYLLKDNKKGLLFLLIAFSLIAGLMYVAGFFILFIFSRKDGKPINKNPETV